MSRSLSNDPVHSKKQMHLQSKQSSMISLYSKNTINMKFSSLVKNIKNSFGVIVCIGSQNFYHYTRQMLLHLDFKKAISLAQQSTQNPLQFYKSQRYFNPNIDIQIISPKNIRKKSLEDDQLQTSFAKANSDDIKHMLNNQIHEIQSQYQLSHNQLDQQKLQLQNPQFKKANSSFVHDVYPKTQQQSQKGSRLKQKNPSRVNMLMKNYQTSSQVSQNKSNKYIDQNFHKDVQQFKSSLQKRKVQEYMKNKGFDKVLIKGQQNFVIKNDFLRVYSRKQIGTDKQKKPIQWLYCQVKQNLSNLNNAILSSYLLASTIIYQLPFQKQPAKQQIQKQIKNYFQFYRKLELEMNKFDDTNSDMPQVVLICPIDQAQNSQTQKTNFKAIFSQLQAFYIPQNKKNINFYQSPYSQYQLSPSKSKLPPTPKRIPMSHKPPLRESSTNITQSNQTFKKKVRLQFRMASQQLAKSGVLRQNYSRMRQITTQGRDIFSQQNIKTIGGNWVYSTCYIDLLDKISNRMPSISIQQFYQVWETIFTDYLKANMQEAVHKYEQKVNELLIGKSMISQSRLEQVHEAAKRETLRQFSQKKIGNSRVLIPSIKGITSGIKIPSSSQNILPPSSSRQRKMSISRKLVQSRKQLLPMLYSFDQQNLYNQQEIFQQQELVNLVQSRIQSVKQKIQNKNKNQSIKWTKKFLQNQYEAIKKKLYHTKQVKTMKGYKHQLEGLRERYRKKLENYSAIQEPQLVQVLEMFVFDNIWGGIEVLMEKQRLQWKDKIKKQSLKVQDLQSQIKQLKKSFLLKQRTFNQQKVQRQNTFQQLQQSYAQMQQQLSIKTKQISYLKIQHQQKLSQLSQQNQRSIQQFQNKMQQYKHSQLKKQQAVICLQSQLEKQQLLHKQTHENYQQILVNYKNNVSQLQKKLKDLKQVKNIEDEQRIKNQLGKQQYLIQQKQMKQSQKALRIQLLEKQLQNNSIQINQLKQLYEQQKQQFQATKTQLETKHSELQISYKVLQQKYIEIQSRLGRYKCNQSALQKSQKQKQQLSKKLNSIINSQAVNQQHIQYKTQQIEHLKLKMKSNEQKYEKQQGNLLTELKDIKQKSQKYKSQLFVNKEQICIETQILGQVRSIKQRCKNCRQNAVKLSQAMKIIQELNKNYQNFKASFIKNSSNGNSKCQNSCCLANNLNRKNLDKKTGVYNN